MGTRMELVAGQARDVLVAIGTEDREGLQDTARFPAYLSLGGGIDPTWLDLFAEAARNTTGQEAPTDFLDARRELDGPGEMSDGLVVERVDPAWVTAVARIPDGSIDRLAGRWIDRIEAEFGPVGSDEKHWIRDLAGQIVAFCRRADLSPDVLFLWALF